ncbi:MAG TPA: hypothetical protein VEC60_08410 [Reyranella sp.]|nr:hypothetical protein [Reyranella sp.]
MTLTIAAAFDLLFGAPPQAETPTYESRLWFRRPVPAGYELRDASRTAANAATAETILKNKILECIPNWRRSLEEQQAAAIDAWPSYADDHPLDDWPGDLDALRHLPPRLPYDVFAIAAYLVENAGLYHYVQPSRVANGDSTCVEPPSSHHGTSSRQLIITEADRDVVARASQRWRTIPWRLTLGDGTSSELAEYLTSDEVWADLEPLFESWLVVFGVHPREQVFARLGSVNGRYQPAPLWWKAAWRLLAISDEAARKTGFKFDTTQLIRQIQSANDDPNQIPWIDGDFLLDFAGNAASLETPAAAQRDHPMLEAPDVISLSVARLEFAAVLPKARTSAVGCTLRSLSHHLALLPGVGTARGRWTLNYVGPSIDLTRHRADQLNVLLVPFPYSIEASSFCGSALEETDGATPRFGYFDLHQKWLSGLVRGEEIVAFLSKLLEAARTEARVVNSVVFPELALDYTTFAQVRDFIRDRAPDVELLIAGISTRFSGRRGNFVAVASFEAKDESQTRRRRYRETVREKHHRWKLDGGQLRNYGLLGVLSPQVAWWENISLQSRRVDFTVFRKNSVLAAMICEDLARVDPCQQLIRAVGPNLVVALLMDAPQLPGRWPARYATILAEDPGCAVLTLTSRGLMTRQRHLRTFKLASDERAVGMWRDDQSSAPITLACDYDAQGILLSIVEQSSEDISLDGRSDRSAGAWRYAGHVPVRVPSAKEEFGHILGRQDMQCW